MQVISWESGTGFDLFVSLCALTDPGRYGLRPTWAAGVRSRLALEDRAYIETVQPFVRVPIAWLVNLDAQPRSAEAVLDALAAIPTEERLAALTVTPIMPENVQEVMFNTCEKGGWNTDERAIVKAYYSQRSIARKGEYLDALRDAWREPAKFGEEYLKALRAYQHVFFAEGEARVRKAQEKGLAVAMRKAEQMGPEELLESLSQGIQFEKYFHNESGWAPDFVLAPSFWSSPLIHINQIDANKVGIVFGCRDDSEGLVPGEVVPPMLIARLKALSDPTRLRILRYLAEEPMTPSRLARKLRLRPPTVTHHLNQLRLAGLVQIILLTEGKRRYAFRQEGTQDAMQGTLDFILAENEKK